MNLLSCSGGRASIIEKAGFVNILRAFTRMLGELVEITRNGRYQKSDHAFNAAFYDLLNGLEKRLNYAKQNTSLLEAPDLVRIEAFQMEVNERVVRDEI